MFGLGKKAQPKDVYEQPEGMQEQVLSVPVRVELVSSLTREEHVKKLGEITPFSEYLVTSFLGKDVPRAKVNPNIISKVWK